MCLALIDSGRSGTYPLIVIANRDEFHARKAAPLAWNTNGILSGRDLQAGGTWMGVNREGAFALLTNIRNPAAVKPNRPVSRGVLVDQALLDPASLALLDQSLYEGFNLICGNLQEGQFRCINNAWVQSAQPVQPEVLVLSKGPHLLSNATLDVQWPKTRRLLERYERALSAQHDSEELLIEGLFEALQDTRLAQDEDLPATGVPLDWERMLSAIKIVNPLYGTRASTVLIQRANGLVTVCEKTWCPQGLEVCSVREDFWLPS